MAARESPRVFAERLVWERRLEEMYHRGPAKTGHSPVPSPNPSNTGASGDPGSVQSALRVSPASRFTLHSSLITLHCLMYARSASAAM